MSDHKRSYESAKCPMAGCGQDLHVIVEHCIPVYADVRVGDFDPGSEITSGWRVECIQGHVVLLPIAEGCSEESATFTAYCERCVDAEREDGGEHHDDYERLANLVAVSLEDKP